MPYLYRDYENNRVYTYEYDSLGRIVRTFGNTRTTGENRFSSQYTYDVSNNITKVVNIADGNKVSTSHTYDAENRPTKTTLNSNVNYEYTYDNLGRLNYYYLNLGSTPLLVNPVYYDSERNADGDDTYLTTQIKREEIGDRGYAYTYDDVGNILTITEKKAASSSYTAKASYEYDALGQLKRENNVDLNQTIVYTYDNGGNIKSKKIYAYTTGTVGALQNTINYTYDSTWKDKLTNYNGTAITYDAIGNPLTYRDNMSFTWNGRQMKSAYVVKTENNVTTTANVNYTYDADGLRTTKQVDSTLHEYEYVGGQLVYEKRGNLKFYYRYNAMGELASIKRVNSSGTEYTVYVVTNTRGDIEELRLASGTMVARYVYDTWGNTIGILDDEGDPITDTSSIAVQNPFRYRGYYYDNESGFYYLQSRYYDPVTCRFVNADTLVNTTDVLGFNMYAYCGNNPVNREDAEGLLWKAIGNFFKKVWNNVKSICTKDDKKLLDVVYDSVKVTAGVGYGLGAGAQFDSFEFDASVTANVVEAQISRQGVDFYSTLKQDVNVRALGFELSSEKHLIQDIKTNEVIRLDERPIADLKLTANKTFGGKAYFIIGFTFEVEIDIDSIIDYVIMME